MDLRRTCGRGSRAHSAPLAPPDRGLREELGQRPAPPCERAPEDDGAGAAHSATAPEDEIELRHQRRDHVHARVDTVLPSARKVDDRVQEYFRLRRELHGTGARRVRSNSTVDERLDSLLV